MRSRNPVMTAQGDLHERILRSLADPAANTPADDVFAEILAEHEAAKGPEPKNLPPAKEHTTLVWDPFGTFTEWDGDADRRAYGDL